MSEKRFECEESGVIQNHSVMFDNDIDSWLTIFDVEKIMNEQHNHIKWLDNQILNLERRNKRQQKRLEELYSLIGEKSWDKLFAIYFDLNKEYDI